MRTVVFGLALGLFLPPLLAADRAAGFSVAHVESLLADGDLESALETLDARLRSKPGDSDALLLRSTTRLMLGDIDAGRRDLERALALDPGQRQGWLNLGALEMSEQRYGSAIEAFARAEELDSAAADNSLNIGAALLLAGRRDEASRRFRRYLEANADESEAFYLVAANYGLIERIDLALPLLRRAISLDERIRLRLRTDPNFSHAVNDPAFQALLTTDSYRLPASALVTSRSYEFPFTGRSSRVLEAVLTALQLTGSPITSAVEVAPSWALVWSDFRIKVEAGDRGGTTVTISSLGAPDAAVWHERVDELLRRVAVELYSRRPRDAGPQDP